MRYRNTTLLNMTSDSFSYREVCSLRSLYSSLPWAQKVKLKTPRSCIHKNYFWHPSHTPMHITFPAFISYPFSSINIVAVFLKLLFQDFRNFYAYCSFFHVPFCMSVLFFFLKQTSERKQYIGCEKEIQ